MEEVEIVIEKIDGFNVSVRSDIIVKGIAASY